jgi:hypothetical protein
MGALASMHLSVLAGISFLHDMQNALLRVNDHRQFLTMRQMNLAQQKSSIFSQLAAQGVNQGGQNQQNLQNNVQLRQLEVQEAIIQALDKQKEMEAKNLETQIQIAQKRIEAEEKMRDESIKTGFRGPGGQ